MNKIIRIGTRDSQLAVWQAGMVQDLLQQNGHTCELVFIKSDGDIDLVTPLYEIGVQGIFTKTLDAALLNNRIDLAVHSMKDVPTQLASGVIQTAVLTRGSYKDILVFKETLQDISASLGFINGEWHPADADKKNASALPLTIATSSNRRKAQWLNRYPDHQIENLRGNVNTRLRKLAESSWNGAIFAAAGLERIGLRPEKSIELDWMLPAPAQGAIMLACREDDEPVKKCTALLNDPVTAICTKIERDFLRALFGGCSTPISALAMVTDETVFFSGNIFSPDGKEKMELTIQTTLEQSEGLGIRAAHQLLDKGAGKIVTAIRNAAK